MATTLKQKQTAVLTMNTMAFAVNFAVWVMFSVIGIKIKSELNLNETEFGLLVATPILTGSLVRLPLGILTDRYGGRIVFFIQMLLVSIPTWLVTYATEYWQYLVLGLFVGLTGGMGGFVLPIMFGVAADAIGVRSSCFMLMFLLVVVTMIWTWVAENNEREAILGRHAAERAELEQAELIEHVQPRRHLLIDWRPDDETFWEKTGRRIANRNLWLSMPALLLAFAVWVVWSVTVVELPHVGFKFTTHQLFWLAALPGLSGAFFRALYSFVVPIFGGRNWTVFSTALLLLPTLWIGVAVQDINTHYAVFVVIALLCGLGAGNFSSSMANISFFYPQRLQGTALGLNGGIGNLGVGLAQLIAPITVYSGALLVLGGGAQTHTDGGVTTQIRVQNAGFIWAPFIVAAAWFGMDNIATVKASFAEQVAIFKHKHQWLMSWLYTGTFGSFIVRGRLQPARRALGPWCKPPASSRLLFQSAV
ncbi:MAG: MFS transporter [Candidatus Competibacteraceae bacterium]|nr:MFS transporter [Candidatus Competibacteraceae bacterium]